jgi:transcriptional regulator with XRE-family HTH domain
MELRRLREAAGLSVRAASQGLGVDQSKISHLEAGRTGVGAERLCGMAAHYACLDIGFIDALVAMTGERPRQWWDAFRGKLGQSAIDLAELEHHASAVRMFQAAYVPGLLQTEDYMRAVLSYAVPEPSPQELDVLVSFRLQRRHVLDRDGAPPFQAVIHEAALRTRVTDRMAACDQLSYLVEQERFADQGRALEAIQNALARGPGGLRGIPGFAGPPAGLPERPPSLFLATTPADVA